MKEQLIPSILPVFNGFYNSVYEILWENEEDEDDEDSIFITPEFERTAKQIFEIVAKACKDMGLATMEYDKLMLSKSGRISDVIYVNYTLSEDNIREIKTYVDENRELFDDYLNRNYSSGMGYISYYPNNADEFYKETDNLSDFIKPCKHTWHKEVGQWVMIVLDFILLNEDWSDCKIYNKIV